MWFVTCFSFEIFQIIALALTIVFCISVVDAGHRKYGGYGHGGGGGGGG